MHNISIQHQLLTRRALSSCQRQTPYNKLLGSFLPFIDLLSVQQTLNNMNLLLGLLLSHSQLVTSDLYFFSIVPLH